MESAFSAAVARHPDLSARERLFASPGRCYGVDPRALDEDRQFFGVIGPVAHVEREDLAA